MQAGEGPFKLMKRSASISNFSIPSLRRESYASRKDMDTEGVSVGRRVILSIEITHQCVTRTYIYSRVYSKSSILLYTLV